MGDPRPAKASAFPLLIAIALIVVSAGGFGYLVTTFLFAFSGGQYRMVAVVNVVALMVVALGAGAAAVSWKLRSSAAAVRWTAIATGIGWVMAIIADWLISFSLGAT